MLVGTPNGCGRIRRSASSSSEYGITELSSATPNPTASHAGSSRWPPASATPNGISGSVAIAIAIASPSPPVNARPTRAFSRMYAAQKPPAASASTIPAAFALPNPPSTATPVAASSAHSTSSRLRDPASATPSGPTNSSVTATPSGIRSSAS